MIYTKEDIFMSYMSMTIYNIYSFLFIIVYIVCITIYLLIFPREINSRTFEIVVFVVNGRMNVAINNFNAQLPK